SAFGSEPDTRMPRACATCASALTPIPAIPTKKICSDNLLPCPSCPATLFALKTTIQFRITDYTDERISRTIPNASTYNVQTPQSYPVHTCSSCPSFQIKHERLNASTPIPIWQSPPLHQDVPGRDWKLSSAVGGQDAPETLSTQMSDLSY